MTKEELKKRTKRFALMIIKLVEQSKIAKQISEMIINPKSQIRNPKSLIELPFPSDNISDPTYLPFLIFQAYFCDVC